MALTTPDVVKIEIDFDTNTKKVVNEIDKLTTSITKHMRRNQKAAEKMGKGISSVWKTFSNSKDSLDGLKKLTQELDQIKFGLDDIKKRKLKHNELISDANAAPKDSDEQKRLLAVADAFAKSHRVTAKEYEATVKSMEDAQKRVKDSATEIADAFDLEWDDIGEALATPLKTILTGTDWDTVGENLASPLHDFLSRDAPTVAKRIGKLLTPSDKVGKWAAERMQKGKAKANGSDAWGGGAQGIKGKVMGGMEAGLGGVVKGLAAIGPILTAATGFFAGFVKVLMDADAAVSEYNKHILETTSTAGYLTRNLGNVGLATKDLRKSLQAARDGAINLSNAQMGISKEVAQSFQSAITAEGVALDRLGKSTATATVSSEEHTKSIQMGVAFSRQFGVSLSEVATMQGQLMADLGMSGKSVTASFQQISDGAADAGMESNKFFGIVRSFSSDLSLFTLRLEDVTKIMGTLGKTMDPRKMGQFLQQLNQKFSGGITDNLKFEMMSEGGGGRDVMQKDLLSKFTNLSHDITEATGSGDEAKAVEKMIKANDERGIAAWSAKNKGKVGGPVVEAITKLMTQNKRLASGDRLDAASVMEELSPLSKMEMLQAASQSMFKKKLEDLSGIELAAAESSGIASAKEIQMYKQFHQGLIQGQEELLEHMRTGLLTEDDEKVLTKLNVDASKRTGAENADALREELKKQGGDRKYYDALDKSQQDLVQSAAKVRDFQAESASLQTSMNDKLGMITDILMNWIFKGLEGIMKLMGGSRDVVKERDDTLLMVLNSKDETLKKSWASGKGDLTKAKNASITDNAGRAIEGLANAAKEFEEVQAKLTTEKDPNKRAELEKRGAKLRHGADLHEKLGSNTKAFQDRLWKIAASEAAGGVPAMMKELMEALEAGVEGDGGASVDPNQAKAHAAAAAQAVQSSEPNSSEAASSSVGPTVSQAPAKAAAAAAESVVQQKATVAAVTEVQRAVANDGVKLHPTTVAGPLKDAMSQAVYEGAAKALFEYYMYSGIDRSQVTNAMMNGMDGKDIAGSVMSGAAQGINPAAALAGGVVQAPGHALGGTVTGILNGMATVQRPAPGEGWASIGTGETILPANSGGGGGGGTTRVQLELKGDLKRFVDARVVDGAAAHERNKRHR